MRDPIETKCPLCGLPRPLRARRCACNYTFEYERPSRPSLALPTPTAQQATAILAIAIFAGGIALACMRTVTLPPNHTTIGFVLALVGLFTIAGAYFNWSFFVRSGRARRVSFFLGRTGARYFYALLGGGLTGAAAGMLIGSP